METLAGQDLLNIPFLQMMLVLPQNLNEGMQMVVLWVIMRLKQQRVILVLILMVVVHYLT